MVSIEHIETPAFLVDVLPDGGFIYRDGNRLLSERTGLGQRLQPGKAPHDLLPAPFASAVVAHYRDCVQSVAVLAFEERFDVEGQSSHWRTTLIPIADRESGRVATLLGIVVDITASKRAELELLRAHARLTLALQAVQGALWEYEVQTHRFDASPALALLLGEVEPRPVGLADLVGRIPVADRPQASFHPLVDGTSDEQVTRFRVTTPAGEERWLKCRRLALREPGGPVQSIFGVTVDVTAEVLEEQRLTREAEHDGLTRLLNRRGFLTRLASMVAEAEAGATPLAVLMLDLDGFKAINDSRGHAAGDAVLAAVGQRIEGLLRASDCAARLGGDEFVLAIPGRDAVRMVRLTERLRRMLEQPCAFQGADIPVAVSMGVSLCCPGQNAGDVLDAADRALYREKRHKRATARPLETLVLRHSA